MIFLFLAFALEHNPSKCMLLPSSSSHLVLYVMDTCGGAPFKMNYQLLEPGRRERADKLYKLTSCDHDANLHKLACFRCDCVCHHVYLLVPRDSLRKKDFEGYILKDFFRTHNGFPNPFLSNPFSGASKSLQNNCEVITFTSP